MNVRAGFWIDSAISNRVHFGSRNEEEGRHRIKGSGPDDDKCHTLNHMFLLKWSDRPKEDLWVCEIFVFFFPSVLPRMCPGTVSTNSNTAGLCRDIHLPSLGMPKWLWRCNSLILSSEQCSSYCYGKSMWLSWMAASMGFCWEAKEHSSNLCRRHHQIKEKKNPKTHHTVLALLNYRVRGIAEQECVHSAGEHLATRVHEGDRWHYCTSNRSLQQVFSPPTRSWVAGHNPIKQ